MYHSGIPGLSSKMGVSVSVESRVVGGRIAIVDVVEDEMGN
jgi:hypothetical protein